MNLFEELGISPRLVAYSVVQQVSTPGDLKEFPRLLAEALNAIRAEGAAIADAFAAGLIDSRLKTAQVARGSLNAYLSTPIKSDNEDVQRIIREALEKYSAQIFPASRLGIHSAWLSRVVPDSSIVTTRSNLSASVRHMLSAGRHLLTSSGFNKGKGLPNIFETDFLLEGGINLDVLETCIRKNMSGPSPLSIAGPQVNELYSVLSILEISKQTASLWESEFHPRGLEMKDSELIASIDALFAQLTKEFNLHQLSLWRTKFASANSQNHSIRIRMIPDQKLLMEIIKWFSSQSGEPICKGFADGGSLIVKEILS